MSIKIGIIGLGHIGNYHIKALEEFPELELAAVCDTNPQLKKIIPRQVVFYGKVENLFRDKNIETVIIATPNITHFDLGCKSLNFGKNVIMEKPAGTSFKEFKKLDSKFKKQKKNHIYYAFHAAKAPEVLWFKKYYEKNKKSLGPITSFMSNFYDPYFEKGKIKKEARGLQNCWIDSGVNALSVLSEITDLELFKRERFSTTVLKKPVNAVVQATAYFSFPVHGNDSSGTGSIDTNWSLGKNLKRTVLNFAFSGKSVELDHSQQKVILKNKKGTEKTVFDFSSKGNRLYNHYLEIFKDYLMCVHLNFFNSGQASKIYKILFTSFHD